LPAGFTYEQDVGADSFEGHFTSSDRHLIVRHDIGGYSGYYANQRKAFAFEERTVSGARV
jgi:hypothetical protein